MNLTSDAASIKNQMTTQLSERSGVKLFVGI